MEALSPGPGGEVPEGFGGIQVSGPPPGVLPAGPVWHASVAARSLPIRSVLEREAERALAGVGDASLGEWRDRTGRAFHIRRRLTVAEALRTGPVEDIRGTPDARERAQAVAGMLRYAPPEVLIEELGGTDA